MDSVSHPSRYLPLCKEANPTIRCAASKPDAQKLVITEVDPSEVLNYDLLNDGKKLGTIRSYLLQQEWFNQAQTKLVAANTQQTITLGNIRTAANSKQAKINTAIPPASDNTKKTVIAAANQMCRNIRNSITELDLNGFDANIVVWAVLHGMPWPDDSPTYNDMIKAEDCKAIDTLRHEINNPEHSPKNGT